MEGVDTVVLDAKLRGRHRLLRSVSAGIAWVVMALALVTLIGWFAHLPRLLIVVPGFTPLQVNTAIALIAAAGALWLRVRGNAGRPQTIATALAALAALFGAVTILQHALGVDLRIDTLLVRDTITPPHEHPGRASLGAGLSLTCLGLALALMDVARGRGVVLALAVFGGIFPYFALLGLLFSATTLTPPDGYVTMSLIGATSVGLLSLGTLLARTQGPVLREVVNFTPGIGVALALFVVVLTIVSWNWWIARSDRARDAQAAFAYEATALRMRLLARFNRSELALTSARALLDSSDYVTRDEWRRFVDTLNVERSLPGILGIGYAPRVVENDLIAHVAAVRQDRLPDYRVWPAGVRELYAPIVYLEPYPERNLRAIGYDMFSEPVRRDALARAMDSGRSALTARVRLIQESGEESQAGFLIYSPAYYPDKPLTTIEERRAALRGWVYSPFRVGDFMRATLEQPEPRALMELYDGDTVAPQALLFRQTGGAPEHVPRFSSTTTMELGGHQWTLRFISTPGFEAALAQRTPEFILYGGTVISVLIFAIALSLITARRRALALADRMTLQLRHTNERLVRQTRELERSNQELEQFAYVASHDLREPLRTVTSFTQLLEDEYGTALPGEARRYMNYIVDGNRRMRMLIDDLLSLSRVGSRAARQEPVPMDEVVQEAVHALSQAIEESGASVEFGDLPTVQGDRVQLVQLFQNLIGNALKFRKAEAPRVVISATRDENWWQFAVADNGIGIERKYFDRIFVIFQRLHGRGEYTGNGIGLAICKKIVERHGGLIWVESEVGSGATFYFTMRAAGSEPSEEQMESTAAST